MGRNLTIRGIAIPVPSGSRQDLQEKLRQFRRAIVPNDAIGLSAIRFAYDSCLPTCDPGRKPSVAPGVLLLVRGIAL